MIARVRNLFKATMKSRLQRRLPGLAIAEGVIIKGERSLSYGTGCSIDVRAYLNCRGGRWNNNAGYIRLGSDCEIGAYSILHGAGGITLGNGVHLGPHVVIHAHQLRKDPHSPETAPLMQLAPVVLEDGVLVGPNVTIAPGVTIGRNSVVAPGSSVLADVPANCIVAGCPARVFITPKKQPVAP